MEDELDPLVGRQKLGQEMGFLINYKINSRP